MVIAGPTAVGKTALAIDLARHFNSVIVSADSRQFYREMSIGTAKPTEKELAAAAHFFINNLGIHDKYSVGDYEKEVIPLLDELFKEHRVVFLVGGSGLYINAVLYGVDEFMEIDERIKDEIGMRYQKSGLPWLQAKLRELDPAYAEQVDMNNPQRLMRAIEVSLQSGKPYSTFLKRQAKQRDFETIKLLINTGREQLYERINQRTDAMMQAGFEAEARALYPFRHLNPLNTVGYKELFDHFDGKLTLAEATELIKQRTRNYAKRQLTWFNNQDEYETFSPDDADKIKAFLDIVMQH